MVETQTIVDYQILAIHPVDGCVQWVNARDWNYPRIVKVNRNLNGGYYPLGVARLTSGTDMLLARWSNNDANVYPVTYGITTSGSTFEFMVVSEACSLRWLY